MVRNAAGRDGKDQDKGGIMGANPPGNPNGEGTNVRAVYWLVLLGLLVMALWAGPNFLQVTFDPDVGTKAQSLLLTLFVIALFVERGLEVHLTVWRRGGRQTLEAALQDAKDATAPDPMRVNAAQHRLNLYKHRTGQYALLGGVIVGMLISLVSVRTLHTLMAVQVPDPVNWQMRLFTVVDVVITGGVIGGGSEGVHKITSVITEYLESTRDKIRAQQQAQG